VKGERYGRLTVLRQVGVKNEKRVWDCKCDCGTVIQATTGSLRSGNTKSCGCLRMENRTKHGQHKTRTYMCWMAMRNRCKLKQFAKYYGDKSVCTRWDSFEAFLADMGHAPDGMTLDRIDNAKGYEPGNCRWASRTIQVRNTRRRREYEHAGQRKSLIEWAEALGISHEMLRGRIRRGWEFDDAISRR